MARIKINDLVKEVTITKNDMENVKGGKSLKNPKKKDNSIIISDEPMATASWWYPDDFYWDPPDEPIDDGWE